MAKEESILGETKSVQTPAKQKPVSQRCRTLRNIEFKCRKEVMAIARGDFLRNNFFFQQGFLERHSRGKFRGTSGNLRKETCATSCPLLWVVFKQT